MTESPLDKVLRLAGGITRGYVRNDNGRAQQVRAYPTPRVRHVAWGSLKAGQVVQIAGVRYKVLQVKVPPLPPYKPAQPGPNTKGTTSGKNTGSQGQGVNTGGPAGTASAGQGVNTVTGATIAQAAMGGRKLPYGTPTVTNEIQNLRTQQRFFVYLPPGQQVTVIG